MQIIKSKISAIAREFWEKTRYRDKVPYDICGAVNLILPLDIISLSELSLRKIELWLKERDVTLNICIDDRALHGFILTYRGSGFIFINGTDSENERRYSVAHEASHFLLDYKIPRDKAIEKLGYQIIQVLDGYREPTIEERIDGILTSVNIQPYTHLLEKMGDGSFESIHIFNSENDADALALELLAPYSQVVKDTKNGRKKLSFDDFKNCCLKILIEKYKLPETIAEDYAIRISYATNGSPSILNKLGF